MNTVARLRKFISALVLILITCSDVFAMPGSGHKADWNQVFGINDYQSQQKVQPLWRTAQSVIDDYYTDYSRLHEKFTWFKLGSSGHRLLFHWGFNADPRASEPLVEQVKRCLRENVQETERSRQENQFFAELVKIQGERNRRLINSVVNTLNVPTTRGNANAIAAIIHDVHILGDYSTTNTAMLPKISYIESDLIKSFGTLVAGGDKSERLQHINSKFCKAVSTGLLNTNEVRARNLIDAVKTYLPPVLDERFYHTFKKRGITLTHN